VFTASFVHGQLNMPPPRPPNATDAQPQQLLASIFATLPAKPPQLDSHTLNKLKAS
jgi:hypothetical protein